MLINLSSVTLVDGISHYVVDTYRYMLYMHSANWYCIANYIIIMALLYGW